jgi:excisionase family DNA binding protein
MESEIEKMRMESIDKMSRMLSNLIAEAINYSKIDGRNKTLNVPNLEKSNQSASKEIYTLKEAAEYMSLSTSYLYKLTHWNKIRNYKPTGKLLYFKKSDLDEWMLQNPSKLQHEIEAIVAKEVKSVTRKTIVR